MKKLIRNIFLTAILLVLLAVLGVIGYLSYNDTHAVNARNYLKEKYDITDKNYLVTKYVKYVYRDLADCNSLWFKTCTDDENLHAMYVFENKKTNSKIVVYEDNKGDFTDDYNGKVTENWEKIQNSLNNNNNTEDKKDDKKDGK